MRGCFIGFKEVFSKPFYVLVAFSGALLFYLLNVIISDFSGLRSIAGNYGSFVSMKLVFYYFIGFLSTLDLYSSFFILVIALLFGSYISLFTFKIAQIKISRDDGSLVGTLGVLFGFIATGCAACGVGIASILGFGGFLVFLPFHGMEIYFIAVILLLYANISIAGRVVSNACPVEVFENYFEHKKFVHNDKFLCRKFPSGGIFLHPKNQTQGFFDVRFK